MTCDRACCQPLTGAGRPDRVEIGMTEQQTLFWRMRAAEFDGESAGELFTASAFVEWVLPDVKLEAAA